MAKFLRIATAVREIHGDGSVLLMAAREDILRVGFL